MNKSAPEDSEAESLDGWDNEIPMEEDSEIISQPVVPEKVPAEVQNAQINAPVDPPHIANGHSSLLEIQELRAEIARLNITISEKTEEAAQRATAEQHDTSVVDELQSKLAAVEAERDGVKEQLDGFLSKILSMKSVFQNYKSTQQELEAVMETLNEVKEDKQKLEKELADTRRDLAQASGLEEERNTEIQKLKLLNETLKNELLELNNECDRLSLQLNTLRRESQEKEDTLLDEKYALENEISKLTKKLAEQRGLYSELQLAQEESAMELKNLALVVDEVNGKLEAKVLEISQAKERAKQNETEYQENEQKLEEQVRLKLQQIEDLEREKEALVLESETAKEALHLKELEIQHLKDETAKLGELQEEVQSKQLVIGKLRHEAIILNEHLTKSLSMLRKQSGLAKNTIDKELILNVILQFLQIPRGDTKKFEALLLISALLEWDDERKIQAGLMHGGGNKGEESRPLRQSFVSLWTDFLEKETKGKDNEKEAKQSKEPAGK